jgi:hypothetical protein
MSRSNGLSTFTSSNIRYFESIFYDNKYKLCNVIGEYPEVQKLLFIPHISDEAFFCKEENVFKNSVRIRGYIQKEDINDNDVFEQIYSFLEHIFTSMKLFSLSFFFKGFNEEKIYIIRKNKEK